MKTQEPIESCGWKDGSTKISHPAFGMIGAKRRHGHAVLYGSDFIHNDSISIVISTSTLNRDLSRDWPFAENELIEVALSEAQWATFVSSLNVGSGVQCTIEHKDRVAVPGLPKPVERQKQFMGEANQKIADTIVELTKLTTMISALKISDKQKKELLDQARMARMQIESNAPFVMEQFGEHMEQVVEKAKIEVNAYAVSHLMRAGLAALGGKPPLLLEDKNENHV